MNLDLTGKNALVCGSTQGIGKAAARELAALGANVFLFARNEEKLKHTLAELPVIHQAQQHNWLAADFDVPDQVGKVIHDFSTRHTVHILVNNTGGPPGGTAIDATIDAYRIAFNSHLICNQLITQALVPGMKQAGYGRIINIISTSVKIPIRGLGVSNTIRGAVASWAKTLSLELAIFGITVNNVLPGATQTGRLDSLIRSKAEKTGRTEEEVLNEMIHEIPAGRIGSPEEVAAAIAFLATPAAAYINGVSLPVDGGRTGCI
ncbi:MAG: SDR family oxidoreductase [Cyclobacteriaceae bacterium]|nr:SDR family oxidoreductase [Cyclobacteriaceae bacterium]MCX7637155.1 SDR family oxidoreductase [Cyclobacteriaceae bacterium]MDW8332336.1 SDR family oxidoreductase [Cyclobacteriaceae bacterium]